MLPLKETYELMSNTKSLKLTEPKFAPRVRAGDLNYSLADLQIEVDGDIKTVAFDVLQDQIYATVNGHMAYSDQDLLVVIPDHTRLRHLQPLDSIFLNLLSNFNPKSYTPRISAKGKTEILIANGSHTPRAAYGGEVYSRWRSVPYLRVHHHDSVNSPDKSGFNELLMRFSQILVVSLVEWHPFCGFSGDLKTLMPGCANGIMISDFHRNPPDPIGECRTPNRIRIERAVSERIFRDGSYAAPRIVRMNLLFDPKGILVDSTVSTTDTEFEELCSKRYHIASIHITDKFDNMIVSAGGHPFDCTDYLALKTIDLVKTAVKLDGTIVLVTESRYGSGLDSKFTKDRYNKILIDLQKDHNVILHNPQSPTKLQLIGKTLIDSYGHTFYYA